MNLKTILFVAMLLTLGVFVACTSDDEEIPGKGSLIALTKKAPADYSYTDPEDEAYHNITKKKNQCAVTALMMRGMEMGQFVNYTGNEGQRRAEELQKRILNAASDLNYNEDSESMPISTMMELGRRLGSEDHPYFRRYDNYSTNFQGAQNYLNNKKTRDSVSCVTLQHVGENGEIINHVAYVKRVDDNSFTYYGYNGTDNDGGKVYFNSTKKNKLEDEYWQITGFLIK